MSQYSPNMQKELALAAKKAELEKKNKEAAREQLLRIALILAKQSGYRVK